MVRSLYWLLGAAVFGVALTMSSPARAETIPLKGSCSYQTSCSASCDAGSINCNVQFVDMCSATCTATASTTCSTTCETECKTNPGSFTCSGYCGGQCDTLCSNNNEYGATSHTACVTDCQGQCSYSCSASPPTTVCATECGLSCQATESIKCSVGCQVKDSASCSITPATCMASCSTGGAIICNGEVVYLAANIADAASWYIAHLDAQFSLSVSGSCTGDQCVAALKSGCAASPGNGSTDGTGLLLAGLAFAGLGIARRRRERNG